MEIEITMTHEKYNDNYWTQYLEFEKMFEESLYYVTPCPSHMAVYSRAFQQLILSIGSELDNVLREISGNAGRSDISVYANYVLNTYPNIVNQTVNVKNADIVPLKPFSGWNIQQPSQSFLYWNNYNMLKHDRILNFQLASLENVINIMASVFIIEMYRFDEIYKNDPTEYANFPDEDSRLFILDGWQYHLKRSNYVIPYQIFDDDAGRRLL